MKAQIVLMVSPKMDSNKKRDRNEDGLIRIGSIAREKLGLAKEKSVELWPDNNVTEDRINRSRALAIFEAFKEDLKDLKVSGMPEEEYLRVGFVTSKTFETICRDRRKKRDSIWIADSITDTVIGGDPEFILLNKNGQVISANNYLRFESDMGCDGALAELRPKPAITPKDFVDNITSILEANDKASAQAHPFQWIAGCYYTGPYTDGMRDRDSITLSVGGHIHIGSPIMLSRAMGNMDAACKSSLYQCMKKVLDELVAVPAMRFDGVVESIKRRSQHGYGTLQDIRTDHGRLEWRTLSGVWMAHPKLAEAVLGASKAVAQAFFQYLEENKYDKKTLVPEGIKFSNSQLSNSMIGMLVDEGFSGWTDIPITRDLGAILPTKNMRAILHQGNIEFRKPYFNKLAKIFKDLSSYTEYRKEIELFVEAVSLPDEELKKLNRNIKANWLEKEAFIVE